MTFLEILKNRLSYDKETGLFTYIVNVSNCKTGDIAGRPNTNGHIQISINNRRYMAHNLAWLYMTGEYPTEFIVDHIDRNYANNKWENLRKASLSENSGNTKLSITNTSGVKGVYWNKTKEKWIAQIGIYNRRVHIGNFYTKEEAEKAYKAEANKHFGEFSR